ncbi:MAG: protein-glutamate O-methyltransferase CheR [Caulobacterales bacterium]|nr:protein-glutamate O-methyltransferase CheR [Caulobacterales bacterium]
MSAADRMFVAALCLARAGLKVDVEKSYLMESRLAPVARREGYSSAHEFVAALRDRGEERQGWAAVEAMAVPECEFFRDRGMFHALAGSVLPALAQARAGETVRVWSAACGGGQEIYSLAMMLADAPPLAAKVELFASDLSERSLEKAQAGLYSQFEVQCGLPARMLVRHFEKQGEAFALSPRIRQMVRWRRVNLLDDLSRVGQFELILCRNLLGQLAPEAQGRITASLRRALAPGGRLAVGGRDPVDPQLAPIRPELGLYAAEADTPRSAAA